MFEVGPALWWLLALKYRVAIGSGWWGRGSLVAMVLSQRVATESGRGRLPLHMQPRDWWLGQVVIRLSQASKWAIPWNDILACTMLYT